MRVHLRRRWENSGGPDTGPRIFPAPLRHAGYSRPTPSRSRTLLNSDSAVPVPTWAFAAAPTARAETHSPEVVISRALGGMALPWGKGVLDSICHIRAWSAQLRSP